MLTVFGPGSDILLVAGGVVFRRNQGEKSFERGVVPFERFLQFRGRDHFSSRAELRSVAKRRMIDRLPPKFRAFQLGARWGVFALRK
jgi:hypothetical protein